MRILFILDFFQVEPLGVGYLAAAMKQAGHEVDWLKSDDKRLMIETYIYDPDILAYSITTGKHKRFIALNQRIREVFPGVISVFGGSHPTFFPEMVREPGVDFIVRGEAEKSFAWLLNELQNKRQPNPIIDFFRLEKDIDNIPFPNRNFLYKYRENRENPIKNVIASRGCRFSCPYCFNSIYRSFYSGQPWVRYRSPENVIEECLELRRWPTKMIYFQDDELLTNPSLIAFLNLYRRKVNIPFHCQVRIELLTDEMARRLKEAGCSGVTFAIESGNDWIRQNVLHRRMNREAITGGIDILRRYGLKFRIENMVGLPGESVSEMLETLDLNIRCRPDYGWASIFQPYPGLPLSEQVEKAGLWINNVDEFGESFFEHTVLKNGLKKETVNMQRLFGIVVSLPIFRHFIRALLRIPNNRIYDRISAWWKRRRFHQLYSEAYT